MFLISADTETEKSEKNRTYMQKNNPSRGAWTFNGNWHLKPKLDET